MNLSEAKPQPQADLATFASTVLHVMETAVFALADKVEDPAEAEMLAPIAVRIDLGGDMHSRIEIAGPFELFAELAADMMGTNLENVTADQATDFLAELANMIAGRWATDALGDEAEVALGIPQPMAVDEAAWQARLALPGCIVFSIDEHYLLVNLAPRLS